MNAPIVPVKIKGLCTSVNKFLNEVPRPYSVLTRLQQLIIPFIQTADEDTKVIPSGQGLTIPVSTPGSLRYSLEDPDLAPSRNGVTNGITDTNTPISHRTTLVEPHPSPSITSLLNLSLPTTGTGPPGLTSLARLLLSYSVNTFSPGFLDKLYAATNAPGLAAELLLATLNTNLHVAHVSPALTEVERTTSFALAKLVGWDRDAVDAEGNRPFRFAGGVAQNGGSASNQLAMLIAKVTMFPETKEGGNGAVPGGKRLVVLTSEHGHYSVEKACVMAGLGSGAVRTVKVDERGRIIVEELEKEIAAAKERGELPFFVNATAGTTVLGSFDPIGEIAKVARREGLWCHVDGSWGGPVLFSEKLRKGRLDGIEDVDSMAITPHKMLGVPVTCSFLVGRDLRLFKAASTLKAG
ncbi:PLP-dependent transferase [Eremomyces bilateralis CBS 781.70]|uniref:PLP-dependent transferase n=1 Tax=Eremomyces bilateralis CBS 781.70 TaxID=1392243 RepID=A0A6G1FXX9_9PEZI|nr:PLP-dependent transferase [Eremomyces bilateralis CBS 781.70]KAF1810634.1 PLP-dependent transferase [Eremomyces bilateralis CBS 781.70]